MESKLQRLAAGTLLEEAGPHRTTEGGVHPASTRGWTRCHTSLPLLRLLLLLRLLPIHRAIGPLPARLLALLGLLLLRWLSRALLRGTHRALRLIRTLLLLGPLLLTWLGLWAPRGLLLALGIVGTPLVIPIASLLPPRTAIAPRHIPLIGSPLIPIPISALLVPLRRLGRVPLVLHPLILVRIAEGIEPFGRLTAEFLHLLYCPLEDVALAALGDARLYLVGVFSSLQNFVHQRRIEGNPFGPKDMVQFQDCLYKLRLDIFTDLIFKS